MTTRAETASSANATGVGPELAALRSSSGIDREAIVATATTFDAQACAAVAQVSTNSSSHEPGRSGATSSGCAAAAAVAVVAPSSASTA